MLLLAMHLMLNPGFMGDNHQVQAIQAAVQQAQPHSSIPIFEYHDNEEVAKISQKLTAQFSSNGERQEILVFSGHHGNTLLKNPEMQNLLHAQKQARNIRVIWVGHQDPGIIHQESFIDLAALPIYMIKEKPELQAVFNERLIPLEAVPNSLTLDALTQALKNWNTQYPHSEETIPLREEGYMAVFLGGDAPDESNVHRFWSEAEAHERGRQFGTLAKHEGKYLLVTNGPRTGKFYPDSPDLTQPVVRHYQGDRWLSLSELSDKQKAETDPKQHSIAHRLEAPLDPISAAFIQGIKESPLPADQFQFIDFRFGKSAYAPILSAVYAKKESSIAFYSAESISYAEIAYFIPQTYAFPVNSMSQSHRLALQHFQKQNTIRLWDFNKPLKEQPLSLDKKGEALKAGNTEDAARIAHTLLRWGQSPLAKVLSAHHFPNLADQLEIIRLLYLSGALDPEHLSADLKASGYSEPEIASILSVVKPAAEDFSNKPLAEFSSKAILLDAFKGSDLEHLQRVHDWLIKVTQREFFARKPGQERWQQATGAWMIQHDAAIRSIVQRLKLQSRVWPQKSQFDAIAIFGASAPDMLNRIQYTKELVDSRQVSTQQIYLLCGERYADKAVDGGEDHLKKVVEWVNQNQEANQPLLTLPQVTETHLMKKAYSELKGQGILASLPVTVIDTPRGSKSRPDTVDTLKCLSQQMKTRQSHEQKMLFISRAPSILAQAESVATVFGTEFPNLHSETVGDASVNSAPLNRPLGALGGMLYGGYVRVSLILNPAASPDALKARLTTLGFGYTPASGSPILLQFKQPHSEAASSSGPTQTPPAPR